jgi:hypothetical protein
MPHEITLDEWEEYEWIQFEGAGFIRGRKKTRPPDDGYKYVDVTTLADAEQKWARAIDVSATGEDE